MKFLVDAQLPRRLADFLNLGGHDTVHTLDLSRQNRTLDSELLRIAASENRVLITKDNDFLSDNLLQGRPSKLLFVSTGNISNADLLNLFEKNLETICAAFEADAIVEISQERLTLH